MGDLQRELDLFSGALQQEPANRRSFIQRSHADEPDLAARLLRLLDAHERAEESERCTLGFTGITPPIDPTPERIGPYRILERIGEGGMGVVYAAEQTEPFRRRVAIKVIKLGMDSREVLARFEAERQALAMMDHPGVAKALDAGVTEQGRPYFVMELVKGLPLVEYCAKQRLPLRERLALFVQVCAAIQHAHQKGIIHRDLKPSNILVAIQEGRPAPKVIDFGVAKATASRLTERTVFTEQGRLIGTPEYMSPEQAEMSGLDVDTRTDVYSLGVILYELLTGVVPFDAKSLRERGYSDLLRTIREVDPPRPSSRITDMARTATAAPSGIDAQPRFVRGELDWIVMRAIAKDRTRRYPAASALAEDVERYLTNRPVLAGPPSAFYVVSKFVRRHRYASAMIGGVVLSVVLGVAGLTVGLLRAREAQTLATRRADNAQAAADFLERVLFQSDPEYAGRPLSLDEVMRIAAGSIDEQLGRFPEVEASVRESMGVAYRRRSMFAEAAPHLRRSLDLRRGLFGDESLQTAPSLVAMANLVFEYQGDIEQSLDLLGRARGVYAAHDARSLAVAWVDLDIGFSCLAGDRLAEAQSAFESSRELLALHRGPSHADVSRPIRGLALVALARGDFAEAERLARSAVALSSGQGSRYIGARAELVLAEVLIATGRFEAASGPLDKASDQFAQTVGAEHIRVAERDAVLAALHLALGETEAAETAAARCLDMRGRLLDEDHWAILEARLVHQRVLIRMGEIDGADAELRDMFDRAAGVLGPDHPLTLAAAAGVVEWAMAEGDGETAQTWADRRAALELRRAARLGTGRR
ncbi:MAG: serine/threonine-protein kinase [Phycisphaerales bacterium]